MRRIHFAILIGQLLSYALIITFIFADATFGLVKTLAGGEPNVTTISACLIGLVGAASIWVSYFYMRKSEAMRDWIVLCAWTQKVKSGNRWITITEFLSDNLGYNVTHGMAEEVVEEMRSEIDSNWKKMTPGTETRKTQEATPAVESTGPGASAIRRRDARKRRRRRRQARKTGTEATG